MKTKNLVFIIFVLHLNGLFAQIGIGTTNPKATLDITSTNRSFPSQTDGLLIPKINDFPLTVPTIEQDGMLIYATGDGTPSKGFYFWSQNNTQWVAIKTNLDSVEEIDDLKDGKTYFNGSSLFLGKDAGSNNTRPYNVGIGYETLKSNTTGFNNTAVGNNTLSNNNGSQNTANGSYSLYNNTTGSGNTALGFISLLSNVSGSNNVALGAYTLALNNTGYENTAVGNYGLVINTSGHHNTAIGTNSLKINTTGDNNVAIGNLALKDNITGSYNIGIGTLAGLNNNGNKNIFIGLEAGANDPSGNNKLYIENSSSNTPLIGGNFSTNQLGVNREISTLTNTFEVGGTASKASPGDWLANSDRRLKKNIHYLSGTDALNKIVQLKGVTYEWNDEKTGIERPVGIQYGFIAQELMDVFPEKVSTDVNGYYQTAYGEYDPFYVEAIKQLKRELDKKQEIIDNLMQRIEIVEKEIGF